MGQQGALHFCTYACLGNSNEQQENQCRKGVEEVIEIVNANLQGEGEEADVSVRTDNISGLRQPETGLSWKARVVKMYQRMGTQTRHN